MFTGGNVSVNSADIIPLLNVYYVQLFVPQKRVEKVKRRIELYQLFGAHTCTGSVAICQLAVPRLYLWAIYIDCANMRGIGGV
jgi:hypothetical protein